MRDFNAAYLKIKNTNYERKNYRADAHQKKWHALDKAHLHKERENTDVLIFSLSFLKIP